MALLRLRTLAAHVYVAESDIVLSLPVGMPEEHCIADSHEQELNPESWQVVDPQTNGMYASATHRRKTSFTVEGAKYLGTESPPPRDGHNLYGVLECLLPYCWWQPFSEYGGVGIVG